MKILLADRSEMFCKALKAQLEHNCRVDVCYDGLAAAQMLFDHCPDLLVLDMDLPGLDGFTILQSLRDMGKELPVIALVSNLTEFEHNWLQSLKVDSVLIKPCTICQTMLRICELIRFQEGPNRVVSADEVVERILLSLSFRMNLAGYPCVLQGIKLLARDPNQTLTKEVYPAVAVLCDGNHMSVERSIRTAIKDAWKRRNDAVWRMYFAPEHDGMIPCPGNGTFLARIAACVADMIKNAG